MENKIMKANNELVKVQELLNNNIDAFTTMNLKLHDAFFESDDLLEEFEDLKEACEESGITATELFYDFCELQYEIMLDSLQEQGLEFKPYYICHTSSFRLHDENVIEFEYLDKLNYECTMYNLLYELGYKDTIPDFTSEGFIDENDEYLQECEANIDYIASGNFYKDVKEYIEPIIEVYDYIAAIKEEQVDLFRDFLSFQNDNVIYEKEKKQEKEIEIWLDGVNAIIR